jgi:hypothetical protein
LFSITSKKAPTACSEAAHLNVAADQASREDNSNPEYHARAARS